MSCLTVSVYRGGLKIFMGNECGVLAKQVVVNLKCCLSLQLFYLPVLLSQFGCHLSIIKAVLV